MGAGGFRASHAFKKTLPDASLRREVEPHLGLLSADFEGDFETIPNTRIS